MNEADLIRVQHMFDAGREAQSFVENKTRDALDTDRMLVLALVKDIEIIGEAASRVSKETQQAAPQIPWAAIVGMRNRLIHAYFEINLSILWETVTLAIPPMMADLEKLIASED